MQPYSLDFWPVLIALGFRAEAERQRAALWKGTTSGVCLRGPRSSLVPDATFAHAIT